LKKHLDHFVKDQFRLELNTHIQEERFEREQYYAARAKAVERPDKYLSIIENIGVMVEKCQLNDDEKTSWNLVLQSIPSEAALLETVEPFALPSALETECFYRQPKSDMLPIDT
jgi:hypothetical protein